MYSATKVQDTPVEICIVYYVSDIKVSEIVREIDNHSTCSYVYQLSCVQTHITLLRFPERKWYSLSDGYYFKIIKITNNKFLLKK